MDRDFSQRAQKIKDAGRHNIIVAGLSYGQGSSREHAAICPMYLGVKVVLARSFERIHAANLINFGILPLTFQEEAEYEQIKQGDRLEIENLRAILKANGKMIVRNLSQNRSFRSVLRLIGTPENAALGRRRPQYTLTRLICRSTIKSR